MANYGDARLREMCDAGWDTLTHQERRAASKWMNDQVRDIIWTRTAEKLVALHPTLSLNAAYSRAQKRLATDVDRSLRREKPEETEFFDELPQDDAPRLTFVDEPPADEIRTVEVWEGVAAALAANRGRWALVRSYPKRSRCKQVERDVNRGRYRGLRPAGAFEARACTIQGEHRLYMRAV